MENCTFCSIIAGKVPCHKVYEDNYFLAFLDHHPALLGHTLVIPKKHYRWVYDVPEFDTYWLTVLKITRAIQKTLQPQYVTYLTYGLKVTHAHVHILPRTDMSQEDVAPIQSVGDQNQLKEIAGKIRNGF